MYTDIWFQNLRLRNHVEDLGGDRRLTLKMKYEMKKYRPMGSWRLYLSGSGLEHVADCYENCNGN
jgi:hypothetical protein